MSRPTDAELVAAFLEATGGLSQELAAESAEGVTARDVWRWRNDEWQRLSTKKRQALTRYLQQRRSGGGAGALSPGDAELLEQIEDVVRLAGGKEERDRDRQKRILGVYIEAWRRRGRDVTYLEALHGRVDRGEL